MGKKGIALCRCTVIGLKLYFINIDIDNLCQIIKQQFSVPVLKLQTCKLLHLPITYL